MTNPQKAIAYEKRLRKWFQRGRDMIARDLPINEVAEQLICDFKTEVKGVHEVVHKANHKAVLESIDDTDATCIWDPDNDNDADTGPPLSPWSKKKELSELTQPSWLMQSLEQPLTEYQTQMIGDLFYMQTCMLEYQDHISMILVELAKSLDPVSFMTVLKASTKPVHCVTLPNDLAAKFQPTPVPPKKTRNNKIVEKISLNPTELAHWGDESTTLYLAATLAYFIQWAFMGTSNMKTMAKKF